MDEGEDSGQEQSARDANWVSFVHSVLQDLSGKRHKLYKAPHQYMLMKKKPAETDEKFDDPVLQKLYEKITKKGSVTEEMVKESLWGELYSDEAFSLFLDFSGVPHQSS